MTALNLPAGSPLWLVAAVVLTPLLLTFLKGLKDVAGPIGWLARRWDSRQVRAVEKMSDLDKAMQEAVDKRVEMQVKPLRERINELTDDLRQEREVRERGEEQISLLREYSILAVKREFQIAQYLAQNGLEMPPPPFPSFEEWESTRNPPGK